MNERPPPAHNTRVAIELQAGEPIQGSLSPETGGTHRFVGWIELANALDALRTGAERGVDPVVARRESTDGRKPQ